jgi:anaerobic magnesium-protoporphyrin IX monomethyl ester cyclase
MGACGAAVSANPDITIRTRTPENIIAEMHELNRDCGVTAFRFVDDLFLGYERFIRRCMATFIEARIGDRYVWDATGRINILHRMSDELLDVLQLNSCREIALGVESGSERLLRYMGKRITSEMIRSVVRRLTERGISVKGYFILGFPTETRDELNETVRLQRMDGVQPSFLWQLNQHTHDVAMQLVERGRDVLLHEVRDATPEYVVTAPTSTS